MASVALIASLNVVPPTIRHLKLTLSYQLGDFRLVRVAFLFLRLLGTKPELIVVALRRGGYRWRVKSHDVSLALTCRSAAGAAGDRPLQ
ncbi:protein of unknown function (plasmid) [Candidatus Methylocalor cossyra]|uniref:Uncharacterized protein n=1 Tax=Candidatus Methylocalor cossyra TaxID=3108543 RepID=A0ABP1CCV2_9GAMM